MLHDIYPSVSHTKLYLDHFLGSVSYFKGRGHVEYACKQSSHVCILVKISYE